MTSSTRRICKNGHHFNKTSSCPTCPICENNRKPVNGFQSFLSAPARRALENAGILSLKKLSTYSEKEILLLHGMGPASLPTLREKLSAENLSFKE